MAKLFSQDIKEINQPLKTWLSSPIVLSIKGLFIDNLLILENFFLRRGITGDKIKMWQTYPDKWLKEIHASKYKKLEDDGFNDHIRFLIFNF